MNERRIPRIGSEGKGKERFSWVRFGNSSSEVSSGKVRSETLTGEHCIDDGLEGFSS